MLTWNIVYNAFQGDFNIYFEFEDEKRNMQFPSKITIRRSICFLTSGLNFKGARECPTDLFRIKT